MQMKYINKIKIVNNTHLHKNRPQKPSLSIVKKKSTVPHTPKTQNRRPLNDYPLSCQTLYSHLRQLRIQHPGIYSSPRAVNTHTHTKASEAQPHSRLRINPPP